MTAADDERPADEEAVRALIRRKSRDHFIATVRGDRDVAYMLALDLARLEQQVKR